MPTTVFLARMLIKILWKQMLRIHLYSTVFDLIVIELEQTVKEKNLTLNQMMMMKEIPKQK